MVDNIKYQPSNLTYGVPQGSVLGRVLFTLYAAPLANITNRHNFQHYFYADDTQLHNSDKPQNLPLLLNTKS